MFFTSHGYIVCYVRTVYICVYGVYADTLSGREACLTPCDVVGAGSPGRGESSMYYSHTQRAQGNEGLIFFNMCDHCI